MASAAKRLFCNTFLFPELNRLHEAVLRYGYITKDELQNAYRRNVPIASPNYTIIFFGVSIVLSLLIATPMVSHVLQQIMGTRCFVPNNYLIWEATRPVSDCNFCHGINKPLILKNLTREEFLPYAYSSQPIIIKNSVSHWPATKQLNYTFLKDLYLRHPTTLDNIKDECQFLHFKSNFVTLADVFAMPSDRVAMKPGQQPWYVGWSNCQPDILHELRQLYPRPHFLPDDAEIPNTDFVFLGYEQGAVMHLDYIPRLMWQAQLQGNKTWILAPTPECDSLCEGFTFYVEPGDAVLIDTRIWYHGTIVSKGQFSLTIQSEYG